ncbi:MAG: YhfT family protein [Lachnospiraceae bacterium]|nr:YhfT family protein [Lachnospiraceae bacterium]
MDYTKVIKVILFAVMSGYATFLANKMIAVYHDGLRPILPEFMNGYMSRAELAAISFTISIGFITGFALPMTVATGIIVIHIILLTDDIIGVSIENTVLAVLLGTMWGAVVPLALDAIVALFAKLPVNFLDILADVGDPIVYAFVAFPAIAVAVQFGKKQGVITFSIELLARVMIELINPVKINNIEVSLSAEGLAMLAGMVCLLYFASKDKTRSDNDTTNLFEENSKRIRGNLKFLAPMGALIGIVASYHWIAGEPIAASLIGKGEFTSAALVAFIQALAFLPLIITTSLVSGVYGTNGWCDWLIGLGYISGNPIIGGVLGASGMSVEIFSLNKVGKGMNKFPALKMAGDNIRSAMTQILEIALLIGGVNAGNQIWPGTGLFAVVGLYLLNETLGRPIMRMAAAPLAAILIGIVANLLALFGIIF